MLEALITTKDAGGFTKGDIICVKLAGSPWGNEERKYHQIVEWEDAGLEAKLKDGLSVISYPYSERKEEITARGKKYPIIRFSTKYVDLDLLPANVKTDVENKDVDAGILAKKDITIKTKVASPDAVDMGAIVL